MAGEEDGERTEKKAKKGEYFASARVCCNTLLEQNAMSSAAARPSVNLQRSSTRCASTTDLTASRPSHTMTAPRILSSTHSSLRKRE
jgi:hypothetical protein